MEANAASEGCLVFCSFMHFWQGDPEVSQIKTETETS